MFKRFIHISLALHFITGIASTQMENEDYDQYGGWKAIHSVATGHFYVKEIDGVWWMIDPEGNAILSIGVNYINSQGDYSPVTENSPFQEYVSEKYNQHFDVWYEETAKRLQEWNFNTAGAWSNEFYLHKLPISFTDSFEDNDGNRTNDWYYGIPLNIFNYSGYVNRLAFSFAKLYNNNPYCIGIFSHNELRWGPDWRSNRSLLLDFLVYNPDDRKGFDAAVQFVKEKYKTIDELNWQWGIQARTFNTISYDTARFPPSESRAEAEEEFLTFYAETYFQTFRDAFTQHNLQQLYLGNRFAGDIPAPVLKVVGKYVDIVCLNTYELAPPIDQLEEIHRTTGRPIMITEFSFRARDSGLPNTIGPGTLLATQADRASHYRSFVQQILSLPYMVGYHWYQYMDQPYEGRFDGQNSNYGLVTIHDEPWQELVDAAKDVNRKAMEIHAASKSAVPSWPEF
ncbi:MAG: beta-agarase [Candidatus Omnitrophota bacterium]